MSDANNVHIICYAVPVNFTPNPYSITSICSIENMRIVMIFFDVDMLTNIISCDHKSGKLTLSSLEPTL